LAGLTKTKRNLQSQYQMITEEQLKAFQKQLQQIDELHLEHETFSSSKFVRWREATKRQITRIFGDESKHFNKFNSISYVSMVGVLDNYKQRQIDQEAFLRGLDAAKTQLLVIIDELNEKIQNGEINPMQENTSDQTKRSVADLVQILRRFRECCQYIIELPQKEKDVQTILWIMLRSHFDNLEKEETLPKFGIKNYKPDFGIPELRVLIEVKFIGIKTEISSIQEEILGDVPGYLNSATNYDSVFVFVYDAAHKLRDYKKFARDLESVEGIATVIVIPGLG